MERDSREWLQTNQLGSYAMGTVDRVPHRKYHSLLAIREPGHGDPLNVLLEVGEYIQTEHHLYMLHGFEFEDRTEPKGFGHLSRFSHLPHPQWTYQLSEAGHPFEITRSLEMDPENDRVFLRYQISGVSAPFQLRLRPFLPYRPIHHLTRANSALNGALLPSAGAWSIEPYAGLPRVHFKINGAESHFVGDGQWVQGILYRTERERGYPSTEDCFTPGDFEITIKKDGAFTFEIGTEKRGTKIGNSLTPPSDPLERAGNQFLIQRRDGFHSIIAGYPWFGSWGRDTLISVTGLCMTTGRLKLAEAILTSYAQALTSGLKNTGLVCADPKTGLIMTGVDTPLLFIRAVQALEEADPKSNKLKELMPIVCDLITELKRTRDGRVKYHRGGLFVEHGPWALTWMDVLMDGAPVTPRTGYAVEINALFYNAVCFGIKWAKKYNPAFFEHWNPLVPEMEKAFLSRFWIAAKGYLADCEGDQSLRPNQLWALGVPISPLGPTTSQAFKEMGKSILKYVKTDLVTPVGLRTLSPRDPRYHPRYRGGQRERDLAYHQGTVWPWLLGIYGDAVLNVEGMDGLRHEFLPILGRLAQHRENEACLGQISEVFDGDSPHSPGGTPAQAWSVSEILRISRKLK